MKITCKDCHDPKEPKEFYEDKNRPTGREASCKTCRGRKMKQKRESAPPRVGATDMQYLDLFIGSKNALQLYFKTHCI